MYGLSVAVSVILLLLQRKPNSKVQAPQQLWRSLQSLSDFLSDPLQKKFAKPRSQGRRSRDTVDCAAESVEVRKWKTGQL